MRQPGLLLRFTIVIVSAVGAASAVVAWSSRSELSGARRQVEAAWRELRPSLDQRYQALGATTATVRSRLGTDLTLLADIDRGVAAWSSARGAVEDQAGTAVRLEGLAARLGSTVSATPRLRSSDEVGRALDAVDRIDPGVLRQRYNEAVAAYEEARGGSPRRLMAAALGFEAGRTLEVPA